MIVLMYHAIGHSHVGLKGRSRQYVVDIADFRRHVEAIASSGLQPVCFGEADKSKLQSSAGKPRYISITFDDGHRSFLKAAEILADRGLPGTFFLLRDHCQSRTDFLGLLEIRELASMGMEVGAHGCSHRHMTRLAPEELVRELADSKRWLEDIISKEVDIMSAPGGFFGRRELAVARGLGYRLIGTGVEAKCRLPVQGGLIPRVCVRRHYSDGTVSKILTANRWWLLGRRFRQLVLAWPKALLEAFPGQHVIGLG